MTELVSNGTFDIDTTGWGALNVTLSVVGGRMRVTNTGTGNGIAYQSLVTEVGATYRVSGDMVLGTSTNVRLSVSNTGNGTPIAYIDGAGSKIFNFVATAATTYVRCHTTTSTAGLYDDFDNVSVTKLPPRPPVRSSSFVG